MAEVIITINKDGSKVEVDAKGFVGQKCEDYLKNIQSALAGDILEKQRKPEYHATEHVGTTVGNR